MNIWLDDQREVPEDWAHLHNIDEKNTNRFWSKEILYHSNNLEGIKERAMRPLSVLELVRKKLSGII